jgi:hypothetical protein
VEGDAGRIADPPAKRLERRPRADDVESRLGPGDAHARPGVEEHVDSLVVLDPSDEDDAVAIDAPRRARE